MQRRKRGAKPGSRSYRTDFDYSQPSSSLPSYKKLIGRFVITILSLVIIYIVFQAIRPWWQTSAKLESQIQPTYQTSDPKEEIPVANTEIENMPSPVNEILQVEVLNGCGASGVGSKFTQFLRSHGYDVVKTDNADSWNYTHTVVIDRKGDIQKARDLAEIIGAEKVIQQIEMTRLLHLSVIIGKDFKKMKVYEK